MAENQTVATKASVSAFLATVTDKQKRADSQVLVQLMQQVTGAKPAMWGPSIIGFGSYHYKYASGREGDMPLVAFSPRKQNLTLYITRRFAGSRVLLAKLGKYKASVACLYVKRLEDIDLPTLKKLIRASFNEMRRRQRAGTG